MEILFSTEQIRERCALLGQEITAFYGNEPLTVVAILNGGLIFAADLIRHIDAPIFLDTFAASSYRNDQSTGELNIRTVTKLPVAGRHVLLVDDILDTGFSLKRIRAHFEAKNPLSVRTCVLLDKQIQRSPDALQKADWVGFSTPDLYVIGYGLDSREHYRNLPYIAVMR